MYYIIGATVTRKRIDHRGTEWTSTRQVPTFLLDGDIQGIMSLEQATRVAHGLLRDVAGDDAELHVTAMEADAAHAVAAHMARQAGMRESYPNQSYAQGVCDAWNGNQRL